MEFYAAIFCLVLVLFHHALVNAAVKPGQLDKLSTRFTVTLPPDCQENGICTVKPIDYPTKRMDRIAKQLKRRSKRHSPDLPVTTSPSEDLNNCVEKREVVNPYVTNNTQHQVVQSNRFFNQTMTVVKCRTEDAPCFVCLGNHSSGKPRFICKTVFNFVNLKIYNSDLHKLESFNYKIPVDCACSKTEDDK